MRFFFSLAAILLLFFACSPSQPEVISTQILTQQPFQTRTGFPEEVIVATEQVRAAAVKTEFALTNAAQPTFTPWLILTPTSASLPTLTPIPNSTPAGEGAYFPVSSDVLGPEYEIENACYFDTQAGWERYEIYAGAVAGSGDEYSAQGIAIVRIFKMMEQEGEPVVELADTKEYLTPDPKGPLRLSDWENCTNDYMLLSTPLNFAWFLDPGGGEFYPYDGFPPLARLEAGGQTQAAALGGYCWNGGCLDGPAVSTSSAPLILRSSAAARLHLPVDEIPEVLTLSAMFVSSPGVLQYDFRYEDKAEWSYEKPDREYLDLGALPLEREQEIKLSLEPGYYVLTIFAAWRDLGDVQYSFLIEVQE